MSTIRRSLGECGRDGHSEAFAVIDGETQKLVYINVQGKSGRQLEIKVREPILTDRIHEFVVEKDTGNKTFDLRKLNIPWIEDDLHPIVPRIQIAWRHPKNL